MAIFRCSRTTHREWFAGLAVTQIFDAVLVTDASMKRAHSVFDPRFFVSSWTRLTSQVQFGRGGDVQVRCAGRFIAMNQIERYAPGRTSDTGDLQSRL